MNNDVYLFVAVNVTRYRYNIVLWSWRCNIVHESEKLERHFMASIIQMWKSDIDSIGTEL